MIVGGGQLDDVGADDIGSGQRSDDAEQFATGQTASFGRACARGVRRVEHVDLDADVHRLLTDSIEHPRNGPGETFVFEFLGTHYRETESLIIAQMLTAVQRTSDSDVNAGGLIDETLFGGTSERCSVSVARTEVGVPRVQMCIEVNDGDGSVNGRDVPKQRKGDRLVTANRDEPGPVCAQCAPARLDLIYCLSDAERVGGNVASVDDLLCGEGLDILGGIVWSEKS